MLKAGKMFKLLNFLVHFYATSAAVSETIDRHVALEMNNQVNGKTVASEQCQNWNFSHRIKVALRKISI
jgi:hypothetical protein